MFSRNTFSFPPCNPYRDKLKAVLDDQQYSKLTENLKDARLHIKSSEVVEGKEICENFECLICKSIPIEPKSCDMCDVLYCKECLEEHRAKTLGVNN
jgi:hypothetical protein